MIADKSIVCRVGVNLIVFQVYSIITPASIMLKGDTGIPQTPTNKGSNQLRLRAQIHLLIVPNFYLSVLLQSKGCKIIEPLRHYLS